MRSPGYEETYRATPDHVSRRADEVAPKERDVAGYTGRRAERATALPSFLYPRGVSATSNGEDQLGQTSVKPLLEADRKIRANGQYSGGGPSVAQEMGDLALGVECISAPADVNDREEIRPLARGVNDGHAPRVHVKAQLLHAVRRRLNKLVFRQARYPKGRLRVTKHEIA